MPGCGVSVVNASSGASGRSSERMSSPTSSDSRRRVIAQNGGFTSRISPDGPTIAVASGIPVRMRCTVRIRLRSGPFSSGSGGRRRGEGGVEDARGGGEERDVDEAERRAFAHGVQVEVAAVPRHDCWQSRERFGWPAEIRARVLHERIALDLLDEDGARRGAAAARSSG